MNNESTTDKGNKPTHRVYTIIGEGDQAIWRELGAAWLHADGKGFNLDLAALPINGRLVMRLIEPKKDSVSAR